MEQIEHVKLLLKYKADPNITQFDGFTPLHLAVIKENVLIIKYLLKYGANPNLPNKLFQQTPVHFACKNNIDPTILLLGGTDRGHSFYDLEGSISNVKCIFAYGETKDRIEDFCKDKKITCYKFDTLKECMMKIKDVMEKGDIVLLSPACASWDQYKKFEDRGNEFKELVEVITK